MIAAEEAALTVEEAVRESTAGMVSLEVVEHQRRAAAAAATEVEAARWIEAEGSMAEVWRASEPDHANLREAKLEEVPLSDLLDVEKNISFSKLRTKRGS